MGDEIRSDDTLERREQSAQHVLRAYRERRRQRRADDTYYGSVDGLVALGEAGGLSVESERRRSEIIEDADAEGMPRDLAELLYDVALEEGLDPALAFELVRTGLGVSPPADGVSTAPDAPVVDKYLPTWIMPPAPTDHVLRERMLRVSFRRLRSLLQRCEDIDEAFRQFANEPDVGHFGY